MRAKSQSHDRFRRSSTEGALRNEIHSITLASAYQTHRSPRTRRSRHGYVALILVLAGFSAPAFSQDVRSQYRISEDEARTGSLIRREIVRTENIPVNKKYHELSPEEKLALHSDYENIAPGDEPPFPAEGLKPIFDAVAKAQAKLLVSGTLRPVADVDRDG